MSIRFSSQRYLHIENAPAYPLLPDNCTWLWCIKPVSTGLNQFFFCGDTSSASPNRFRAVQSTSGRHDVTFPGSAHNAALDITPFPYVLLAHIAIGSTKSRTVSIPLTTGVATASTLSSSRTGTAICTSDGYSIGTRLSAPLSNENFHGHMSWCAQVDKALTLSELEDLSTGKTSLLDHYASDIMVLFDFSKPETNGWECPYSGHYAKKKGGETNILWLEEDDALPLSRAPYYAEQFSVAVVDNPTSINVKDLFPSPTYLDNGVFAIQGTLLDGLSFSSPIISGTPITPTQITTGGISLNTVNTIAHTMLCVSKNIDLTGDGIKKLSYALTGKWTSYNDFITWYLRKVFNRPKAAVSDLITEYLNMVGWRNK